MTIYFDRSALRFLDDSRHGIPAGSVRIEKSLHETILQEISKGKDLACDESGMPVAVDRSPAPVSDLLSTVKHGMRAQRAPMLDALTGIAGRAQRAGNAALAAEADALAEGLLDITDNPALNAAQTMQDMQAAGVAAYRAIAATASPALASVFKEHTGV